MFCFVSPTLGETKQNILAWPFLKGFPTGPPNLLYLEKDYFIIFF
jgi:hypothetical protein